MKVKKSYNRPALLRHGSVERVTLSSTGSFNDNPMGGATMMMMMSDGD